MTKMQGYTIYHIFLLYSIEFSYLFPIGAWGKCSNRNKIPHFYQLCPHSYPIEACDNISNGNKIPVEKSGNSVINIFTVNSGNLGPFINSLLDDIN